MDLTKAGEVKELKDWLNTKYNLSLDQVDELLDGQLKQIINDG